ncbi:Vitamin B12 import ATP-binding protein BtuD [Bacillus safensis subsp. safensis]
MIEFNKVSMQFSDERYAVQSVDLEIQQGEFFVLIGPSGSGKTTTLKMINRLISSKEGEIYIKGQKISDYDMYELRWDIGYVLQQIALFPHMTIEEIVTMEPKLRYRAIQKGDINLVDAYSTDSELRQYKLKVLDDDQHVFPPYQGAPLLRQETLTEFPEIETSLNKLAGQITDDEMREMNYEVNVKEKDAFQVAKAYLKKKKLLQ